MADIPVFAVVPGPEESPLNLPDAFRYTGQTVVCCGQTLPLYEPSPRKDGRPSINTLEGWNLHRHDMAERTLRRCLQREPTEAEIQEEMAKNAAFARRLNDFWVSGASAEDVQAFIKADPWARVRYADK